MSYTVKIIEKPNYVSEADLQVVKVGFRSGFGFQVTHTVISENASPIIHLSCYTEADHYHFQTSALVWNDIVVVGAGHRCFTLNLTNGNTNFIDLDAYFSEIYMLERRLLITSGMNIHAIDSSCRLLWSTNDLGNDGVIIDEVKDGKIFGQGQMNPPNGWKPFVLDLATGKRI